MPEVAELSVPENQSQLIAFVDERVTEQELRDLEDKIRGTTEVESVTFVSREEVFEDFFAELDDDNKALFDELDATIFRHRFIIILEDEANMQETQTLLRQTPGIAEVIDPYDIHPEHAE